MSSLGIQQNMTAGNVQLPSPRLQRINTAYYPSPDALGIDVKNQLLQAMSFVSCWRIYKLIKKKNRVYHRCKQKGTIHLEEKYNRYVQAQSC